ncbi:MAG TPA: hypothetical protein VGN90_06650 [Pyrinomonadaceae bacterium]|jgi:hypothetical protein|nr:hypothetical protein [Pyrinomonadaceae bacterium]
MLKQISRSRTLVGSSLFLLFAGAFFIAAAGSLGISAQTRDPKKVPPGQTAAIANALRSSFGSVVESVTVFKPYYVIGDFNGDGAEDIVVAVRIKGQRSDLPADVTVYNPFERPKAIFPADPLATPTLALAIIHGKSSWQTPPAAQNFLLFGQSPVLILNYGRVTAGDPAALKTLIELLGKRSTRLRDLGWPPAAAKGDAIILGTEATDSILYWTGKNYRWEEAAGGE